MIDLSLGARDGLPPALRVLVEEIPRETWQAHPNFGGTVAFWMQRHLMFRRMLEVLRTETEALVDRRADPAAFAPRLARIGGSFLNELHGHHRIEDTHYFPRLIGLDSRLERGFAILDADHHALDAELAGFAEAANAVLAETEDAAAREAAATLRSRLVRLDGLLDRHLADEEEIVVPVILGSGFRD